MLHTFETQIITCTIGALGLLITLAVYLNASNRMRNYVRRY